MYKDKTILAIVPARGGSKGIKLKNLSKIHGKSLIEYVADVIHQSPCIDKAVVSTDHPLIKAEAELHSIEVPFMRPADISGDLIGDLDVLKHATQACEMAFSCTFDVILMLQPTSPLRKPEHIEACVHQLIDKNLDSVWTVSPTDSKSHPLKQLTISDDTGHLGYYDSQGKKIIARQMLEPVFHRNGLCYAFTRHCIFSLQELLPPKNSAIVVEESCISIDTEYDLKLAELYLTGHFDR